MFIFTGLNTGPNIFEAINWGSPGWPTFANVCTIMIDNLRMIEKIT